MAARAPALPPASDARKVPSKTAECGAAPGPEGLPATSGLLCSFRRCLAPLQGVADSERLGEPRRGPSQWRSAACVRKINARIRAAGHLVLVLFRATHPFGASLVNTHRLGLRHPPVPGRVKNSLTCLEAWSPDCPRFLKPQLPPQTAGSKSKAFLLTSQLLLLNNVSAKY